MNIIHKFLNFKVIVVHLVINYKSRHLEVIAVHLVINYKSRHLTSATITINRILDNDPIGLQILSITV